MLGGSVWGPRRASRARQAAAMRLLLFSRRARCLPSSRLASPSRPVSAPGPPPWRPHLQARVHLQEEELALRVGQELHRPGRVVAHRLAQRHRLLPHGAPHLGRDQRGGRLLNHLVGSGRGSFGTRAGQMTRGWEGRVAQMLCQRAAERTSLGAAWLAPWPRSPPVPPTFWLRRWMEHSRSGK